MSKGILILAVLTLALSQVGLPALAKEEVTFRMSLTEGVPKFFTMKIGGGPQQYVAMQIFEPLVLLDIKTLEILPNLAQSWDVSPDGLTYTFHLVRNAKWHDGVPFTSADVKYTFEYDIQNRLWGYGSLSGIQTIETPDDYTVVIALKGPDASFLVKVNDRWRGNTDIFPKHILEGKDWTKAADFLQHPIGTGPYKFESYDGNTVVLLRNDEWWRGTPGFAKVLQTVIPSTTLAVKAFENNELDWLYTFQIPTMSDYLRLKDQPGNVGDVIYAWVETLQFNFRKPPFSDLKVREAFAYAIDREEINRKVYLGYGKAQVSPFFPDWLAWSVNPNIVLPPYDPDRADQILDQAGYARGSDGVRFTIRVAYAAPFQPPPEFVDVLKFQLEKVGIKVLHEPNEWDVWYQKVYENRDFDVAIRHSPVVGDPEMGVADTFVPGRIYNIGYNDTEITAMFEQAKSETNRDERARIYYEIQSRLADVLPYIMLVDAPTPILWKSTFGDLMKGDNHRLTFAHSTTPPGETTTATSSSVPTEPLSYAVVIIVLLVVVGGYAYLRRRKIKSASQ